jgi:hypothetical protein
MPITTISEVPGMPAAAYDDITTNLAGPPAPAVEELHDAAGR